MEYEDFLGILMPYKKLMEDFRELYSMGFNFMDGKYELENNVSRMFDAALNSHFTEEGVEWINWFVYENDWGKRIGVFIRYSIHKENLLIETQWKHTVPKMKMATQSVIVLSQHGS